MNPLRGQGSKVARALESESSHSNIVLTNQKEKRGHTAEHAQRKDNVKRLGDR